MIKTMKANKEKIEYLLEKFPSARENDNDLTFLFWVMFDKCTELSDMLTKATPPESIRRVRQRLNQEGKYLPKNPEVRKKRRIGEYAVRKEIKAV